MILARTLALVMLAGCSAQPANDSAPPPERAAQPSPPAREEALSRSHTLPKLLLGAWTADPGGGCAAGNERRIDVLPDRIDFYESRARITAVTPVGPRSWGVDAAFTGEGESWSRSFDLTLNADGTMTRVEAPIPDITYTRCESET